MNKKEQRRRGRERYREQEHFIGILRTGLSAQAACEFLGYDSARWWHHRAKYDPVFAERVSILDRINRGLDHRRQRSHPLRYRADGVAHIEGQTPRQSQKAYEDLVDLRQKEAFIAMYREGQLRTEAAHKLGLATIEVLDAMKQDREFAREIESVQLAKLWDAEDEMYKRAKESGVDARFLMKKLQEQLEATTTPKRRNGTEPKGPSWA
jgi:hypothetical protein